MKQKAAFVLILETSMKLIKGNRKDKSLFMIRCRN